MHHISVPFFGEVASAAGELYFRASIRVSLVKEDVVCRAQARHPTIVNGFLGIIYFTRAVL